MKKALIFITSSLLLHASIVWYSDFYKAYSQALKSKKYMLVYLTDKKSQVKRDLFYKIFYAKNTISFVKQHFESVYLVKEINRSYPIELLYTNHFPTLFILDESEQFVCDPLFLSKNEQNLLKYLKNCIK